jgi:hypothetical protein
VPIVALERMLEEARPTARKAEAEELFADAGWPPEAA